MTSDGSGGGERPNEPGPALRKLVARLADAAGPGAAGTELIELGRRLGADPEGDSAPTQETEAETGAVLPYGGS